MGDLSAGFPGEAVKEVMGRSSRSMLCGKGIPGRGTCRCKGGNGLVSRAVQRPVWLDGVSRIGARCSCTGGQGPGHAGRVGFILHVLTAPGGLRQEIVSTDLV